MRQAILRISERLDNAVKAAAAAGLALMLLLVIAQIIARYVLRDPPAWLDEAARTVMVWTALLGATSAFRAGLDPRVMDRKRFATPWLDRLIGLGRPAAVLLFAGALLMASPGFLVRHSARATDALGWNSAIIVAVVPLFAGLMVLHLLAQMLRPDPAADKAAGG